MDTLVRSFESKFGALPTHRVRSPLRICPLGAHVDHQDGKVTGMALAEAIDFVFRADDSGYLRVQSNDFPDEEYFHLDQVPEMIPTYWGNYLRGAVLSLQRDYKLHRGVDGVISGRLPIGGLSSSAAVTTAYLLALCEVNGISPSQRELIAYSHWVETGFIGLNNGILDQSANILSRDGHLMVMDCSTEEARLVPRSASMPPFDIVVVYSGISTSLIQTDYNNRVEECKVAAWTLQEAAGLPVTPFSRVKMRDIPREAYESHRDVLAGRFARRAEHFFSELDRVDAGVTAWERGDIVSFGNAMFASGESSIVNYESGCPELTTIYTILRETRGVYGARFSGAGYRGCCIGVCDPAYRDSIRESVAKRYPAAHRDYADRFQIHFVATADGAAVEPL